MYYCINTSTSPPTLCRRFQCLELELKILSDYTCPYKIKSQLANSYNNYNFLLSPYKTKEHIPNEWFHIWKIYSINICSPVCILKARIKKHFKNSDRLQWKMLNVCPQKIFLLRLNWITSTMNRFLKWIFRASLVINFYTDLPI